MTFYDSERITRKQEKHEKSRAYDIISVLQGKAFDNKEILGCLEVMSSNVYNSETQVSVLARARKIINYKLEQELIDAANLTNTSTFINDELLIHKNSGL